MENTRRGAWVSLLTAVFTVVAAFGCASTSPGARQTIGPNDLPSLAGKWNGTMTLPSGRAEQGTMELMPNGDYTVRVGSGFNAQGKAQVRDGGLLFVPTATAGGGGAVTGPRSSVASLSKRPDGSLVLSGNGHSPIGPFDFEVVRQK